MSPLPLVERELAAHAAALRALARALVGEEHAEDIVQETALRALGASPAEPTGLFGWLATTLRRLASNHRRQRRRRREREGRAAQPESVAPADAALERRESLRLVTDAVLALPSLYQTAIVLRFFEGLTPRAIAERTGVPLATVKSRQQRALLLLRGELDRRDRSGRWLGALAAVTGLCRPTPTLLSCTGTLLMTPTTKSMIAVGATAVLGAALLLTTGGGPLVATAVSPSPDIEPGPASVAGTEPAQRVERREVPGPPVALAALDLAHARSFELRCRVLDRRGAPVRGARLFFAPAACALNTWPATTDDDGIATLRWHGRQSTMVMAVGVRHDRITQILQQVEVQAEVSSEIALLGEQQPGRSAAREVTTCEAAGGQHDCRACHQGPQLRSVFDERLHFRKSLHPVAAFADLLMPRPATGDSGIPLAVVARSLSQDSGGLGRLLGGGPAGSRGAAATGRIVGRVYGPDGVPVANEPLVWGQDVTAPTRRTRSRADGTFSFTDVPVGPVGLRCGGGDLGTATATTHVIADGSVPVDLWMQVGAEIRGRAIGSGGAPLRGWRVEYVAQARPWTDACTVREDGTFVLTNLPAGAGRLLLWPVQGTQLPAAIESGVLPGGAPVVFDLRERGEPEGALRVRALLPPGFTELAAEVRVWQQESDRGAVAEQTRDGAFVVDRLAAGFYRVEIGGEVCGWRDLGRHWVDGKTLCDLGHVDLPRPGRVRVVRGVGVSGTPEFYLRRPDGDVRAEDLAAGDSGTLLLPAGDWLSLWRGADGRLGGRTFQVQAGATCELVLGAPVR